jgi:exopolysaccharide biosynthesis polyprenyl glycosylphosphotransferase
MDTNGILQKHWLGVLVAFATDALLLVLGFLVGAQMRLGGEWTVYAVDYFPSLLLGAFVLPCACYIFGLYTATRAQHGMFARAVLVGLCLAVTLGIMLAAFYVNYSGKIGRGVMLISMAVTYATVLLHHAFLLHRFRSFRERVAILVSSEFDEEEARWLADFGSRNVQLVGVVAGAGFQPAGDLRVLGEVTELESIARREKLDRVLCTSRSITETSLYRQFCHLRYSGVPVMPFISLCEEVYHCVPLELVTPEWLLSASAAPHVFYIRKLKRGFDIAASLIGLVCFSLPLLAGVVIVLLSRGPILYRQRRSGRFGRPFEVIKLRTMQLDAEKDGAQWSSPDDARVIRGGGFLRRYRIDEIPQLINVLRGEMSFVGPRPERPEFVKQLAAEIPFFEERLMVQPGITGWAQVNYPYGASVADARRKLEYDLYYMKNMSLFLDVFILLDTIRIILRGGMDERSVRSHPVTALRAGAADPASPTPLGELPVSSPKPGTSG